MLRIGITGGIGAGKSTAQKILEEHGLPVIDTDQLARDLVQPGQPALTEITEAFGKDVLSPDGSLNRAKVADLVFGDPEKKQQLESILHPKIRHCWQAKLAELESSDTKAAAVVIPLLFETDAQSAFGKILCLACPPAQQHTRLKSRGWSDEHTHARLQTQWPIQKKMDASDHVIWNSGTLELLKSQLLRVVSA